MRQNPFVYETHLEPRSFSIGFNALLRPEPLWWIGSGFKDLSRVRAHAEEFPTRVEAEDKIRSELLEFIRKYRQDQAHLISGW